MTWFTAGRKKTATAGPTLANSPEHPSNAVAIDLCNCLIVAIYLNIMYSSMTFLNSSLKQLVSGPTVHTLQFECQECDANAFSRLPGRCPGARQGMRQHDHRPHAPSWLLQSEMCRCQKVQSRQSLTCSAHPTPSYFHQGAAFNFTLKRTCYQLKLRLTMPETSWICFKSEMTQVRRVISPPKWTTG